MLGVKFRRNHNGESLSDLQLKARIGRSAYFRKHAVVFHALPPIIESLRADAGSPTVRAYRVAALRLRQ